MRSNGYFSLSLLANLLLLVIPSTANLRCMMYLTGQHYLVPEPPLVSEVTHVALAFMQSSVFNIPGASEWPLFTTVDTVRSQFANGTAIMIAIGGWGDTRGFSEAAASEQTRQLFARNVKAMVEYTGADGVDIDWEYPGGNGEDYKQVPNAEKVWEIEAYPKLLAEIRLALGPGKLMSAALPGLPRDMISFNNDTIAQINSALDFFNIMTYDLMNRRDNITKHHTGIDLSIDAVNEYLQKGMPPEKAHLGFAFYVKWFKTRPNGFCNVDPIGCETVLMEDPLTGADLGMSGAFAWDDMVPPELSASFERASNGGQYDGRRGGYYFWDPDEDIWWTWDTPEVIAEKFPAIMEKMGLGGVFAWGLGEDSDAWSHLKALTAQVRRFSSEAMNRCQEHQYSETISQVQGGFAAPSSDFRLKDDL